MRTNHIILQFVTAIPAIHLTIFDRLCASECGIGTNARNARPR